MYFSVFSSCTSIAKQRNAKLKPIEEKEEETGGLWVLGFRAAQAQGRTGSRRHGHLPGLTCQASKALSPQLHPTQPHEVWGG